MHRPAIAPIIALLAATPATAQIAAPERQAILADVDARSPDLAKTALAIWNAAEVGYQETKSSALLQAELKRAGFAVTPGVAGMPTAFVASFKRGGKGPVIGILAEYDALPGLAQRADTKRDPIPGQAAGHGCGHNIFGAASVTAAIAVKDWMVANAIDGEVRVYGSPAEEGGSGKVYLVRAGLFNDVDAVLHWHPSDFERRQHRRQPGQYLGQVPLPRRVGARLRRARQGPLRARRRRGDERRGQLPARTHPDEDAHPLCHHERWRGAQRRP